VSTTGVRSMPIADAKSSCHPARLRR
jgi:hypothetical protein